MSVLLSFSMLPPFSHSVHFHKAQCSLIHLRDYLKIVVKPHLLNKHCGNIWGLKGRIPVCLNPDSAYCGLVQLFQAAASINGNDALVIAFISRRV